ncbi:unnamed protein product, partial [Prorocentrum cordatum]
ECPAGTSTSQAPGSLAGRRVLPGAVAAHALPVLQVVGGSIVFLSSPAGLAVVNRALTGFCLTWRHRFQGGRQRPVVLAVVRAMESANCGTMCDVPLE